MKALVRHAVDQHVDVAAHETHGRGDHEHFRTTSDPAATTETSAVLRCGLMVEG